MSREALGMVQSEMDLKCQAAYAAEEAMKLGMESIAREFGVKPLSAEHVDLCKALLPAFMDAEVRHFAIQMQYKQFQEAEQIKQSEKHDLFG